MNEEQVGNKGEYPKLNDTTSHFSGSEQRHFNNKKQVKQVAACKKIKC